MRASFSPPLSPGVTVVPYTWIPLGSSVNLKLQVWNQFHWKPQGQLASSSRLHTSDILRCFSKWKPLQDRLSVLCSPTCSVCPPFWPSLPHFLSSKPMHHTLWSACFLGNKSPFLHLFNRSSLSLSLNWYLPPAQEFYFSISLPIVDSMRAGTPCDLFTKNLLSI